MPRLPRITARELLRILERDGWYTARQSGSHVILHHPTKRGRVVVPVHHGKPLRLGTLAQILDDAGLRIEAFGRLQ